MEAASLAEAVMPGGMPAGTGASGRGEILGMEPEEPAGGIPSGSEASVAGVVMRGDVLAGRTPGGVGATGFVAAASCGGAGLASAGGGSSS